MDVDFRTLVLITLTHVLAIIYHSRFHTRWVVSFTNVSISIDLTLAVSRYEEHNFLRNVKTPDTHYQQVY